MKQRILVLIMFVVTVLVLHISCNKETVNPDLGLPFKQLDYITDHAGEILFKFYYENDTIVEFEYFGHYYSYTSAVFRNGKLFRYYYPENHYVQYSFPYHPNDSVMYVTVDQDSTNLLAVYYFTNKRVSEATFYPFDAERYRYKYFYNSADNLTSIEYRGEGSNTITEFKFTHDDTPNPWYGMGIVDDFMSFSRNNYVEINDYPYLRYTYDEEGYMIASHNVSTGTIYKYYYLEN